jgi:hypothetical protein
MSLKVQHHLLAELGKAREGQIQRVVDKFRIIRALVDWIEGGRDLD